MKTYPENKSNHQHSETAIVKETKTVVSSTEERRQHRERRHRDSYFVKVNGQLIPVSEEVFDAYHYYERRGKSIEEKDFHNGVMSYNALDTDDMLGEDIFPDDSCGSIEDMVISHVLIAQLRTYMAKLSDEDQLLLKLSFFDELPEQKIAERTGLPKSTVNYHKARAIKRLREYFNV